MKKENIFEEIRLNESKNDTLRLAIEQNKIDNMYSDSVRVHQRKRKSNIFKFILCLTLIMLAFITIILCSPVHVSGQCNMTNINFDSSQGTYIENNDGSIWMKDSDISCSGDIDIPFMMIGAVN